MDRREFFDAISSTYNDKYSSRDQPFLSNFFQERLDHATADLDLHGRRIVDVGAGTGQLYDRLVSQLGELDYFGVDLSAGMLANSNIPEQRRLVGTLEDVQTVWQDASVDYFFMLGVTTYMSKDEIAACFRIMHRKAREGGTVIVTLSNAVSAERSLQSLAHGILRMSSRARVYTSKKHVAAQGFERTFLTIPEFERLVHPHWTLRSVVELNQTFTPFNRMLPTASLKFQNAIRKFTRSGSMARSVLSSDLLLRMERVASESATGPASKGSA